MCTSVTSLEWGLLLPEKERKGTRWIEKNKYLLLGSSIIRSFHPPILFVLRDVSNTHKLPPRTTSLLAIEAGS